MASERPSAVVLNVNDHEATRYYVSKLLRAAGHEVLEASTGTEALQLARRHPVDLVVLDVQLPDISGIEVCRMLKRGKDTQSIMVMHLSAAYTSAERRAAGLDSGADAYLTSSFEPPELLATIGALLRLRRTETKLREQAEALTESARRKDEFMAMLAHELRNPLSAITSAVALLDEVDDDPARRERAREVLSRQTHHLTRIVDDLLDAARYNRGLVKLQSQRIDLVEQIRGGLAMVGSALARRDQTVSVALPSGPLWVDGDASRLQQVFTNLIDNASKYSPRGAEIRVAARVEAAEVVVEVIDVGEGIAPEFLAQIFELFSQADQSLDRARGGLGIGLNLVHRIVQLHGGNVEVVSAGLGEGTTCRVRFPAAEVDPGRGVDASTPDRSARSGMRVLVVEDNCDSGELLVELLNLRGHAATLARDAEEALGYMDGAFDVGVFDVGLPGMDGYELARRLRQRPDWAELRLIALTGYGNPEETERALAAGFDVHLTKPVDIEVLIRMLGAPREEHR